MDQDENVEDCNVVEFEEFRLRRVKLQDEKAKNACLHTNLLLDEQGEYVECEDCGKHVSAFYALKSMHDSYSRAMDKLLADKKDFDLQKKDFRELARESDEIATVVSRFVADAWKRKKTVPTCPHCAEPIFPNDGFGDTHMDRDLAKRRKAVLNCKKAGS